MRGVRDRRGRQKEESQTQRRGREGAKGTRMGRASWLGRGLGSSERKGRRGEQEKGKRREEREGKVGKMEGRQEGKNGKVTWSRNLGYLPHNFFLGYTNTIHAAI